MINDKKINLKLFVARLIVSTIKSFLFCLLYLFYSKIDAKKHSFIITESFYSPWKSDKKFQKTLKQIKKNTKLDHYRLYSLWELIEEISNLNGDIIEIDTNKGFLKVHLTRKELTKRRKKWRPKKTEYTTGTLWKYSQSGGPAFKGAVTHPGASKEKKCYADI